MIMSESHSLYSISSDPAGISQRQLFNPACQSFESMSSDVSPPTLPLVALMTPSTLALSA